MQAELQRLKDEAPALPPPSKDDQSYREHAAGFWTQLRLVTHRVYQQYWRTPSYIYAKAALCISVALFIGLCFLDAPITQQGLQNQSFAIFNILTVFGQLCQQPMPYFVVQRSLYEVRERPSKVYGWKVFMPAQTLAELPYNSIMALFMFVCWYYPVGLQKNAEAAGQTSERGALIFLLLLAFMWFTATFTHMVIAAFETAEAGGNVANILFMMCLIFCGVLANPDSMPRFWIFMYRVSPFSYLVSSMLSTAVANTAAYCADNEFLHFDPVSGQNCDQYMDSYINGNATLGLNAAGGYLTNPSATENCEYCPIGDTNAYLASVKSKYSEFPRAASITLSPIQSRLSIFSEQVTNGYSRRTMAQLRYLLGLRRLQRLRCPVPVLAHPRTQGREEGEERQEGIDLRTIKTT